MAILRTVAALCFFAVVAHSLPSVSVVPETGMTQAKAAHADAAAKVQALLQSGQTEADCKTLAESTISDITASVASSQGILDSLDKGYTCKDEGQADVTAAEQAKKEADDAAAAADEALTAATTAPVELGPQAYNMLKTGDCGWIKTDPAFVAAHATYTAAVEKEATTNAEATAAAEALQTAIETAARLKAECECRVQKEHEDAWAAATENNDANTQAWTQAQNMLCVLDHKESADCTFDPCPAVTKPVVDPEVLSAECASYTAPPPGTGFENDYLGDWMISGKETILPQSSSLCGVARNPNEDHAAATGTDAYMGYTPYLYNGQINTGCSGSCNGGTGIDFGSHYKGSCAPTYIDNGAAYAKTTIYATHAQEVTLDAGSDDGIIVWLNGVEVFAKLDNCRCYSLGQFNINLPLTAGPNNLVIKIGERGGHFGFVAKIAGAEASGLSAVASAAHTLA